MNTTTSLLAASLLSLLLASTAQAQITIDFDADSCFELVTDQYEGAIFSSEPGYEAATGCASVFASSPPNYLCSQIANGPQTCLKDLYVDFTVPVKDISFMLVADHINGQSARVKLYDGTNFLGNFFAITDGNPLTPDLIDLQGFDGVTRIEIVDFLDGMGVDDLTFTPDDCRNGSVNTGVGAVTDVLFVNGARGRVQVPRNAPITVSLDAAPLGPGVNADYVLWVWVGSTTNPYDLNVGTGRLGCVVNPTPLQPFAGPQPFRVLNGGMAEVFTAGVPVLAGAPAKAPWSVTRALGFSSTATFMLQAILEDNGSRSITGYSATNAIFLEIQ